MAREYISRRETMSACPPIETWPTVLPTIFEIKDQTTFNNRSKAVEMYISGDALDVIAKKTSISKCRINSLCKQCLNLHSDGRIYGFRALIPNIKLKKYLRKTEIKSKFEGSQWGMSGIFKQILNKYPAITSKLDQYIFKINSRELNVHEKKIRATDLHTIFLDALREKGFEENQWPFNTKYLGFKTIQKYLNSRLNSSFGKSVRNREEQVSAAHLAVGTGHDRFLEFKEPYDLVQLDAYSIEAFFTSKFETPEGTMVDVQLERIWHIALIDVASSAILSYKTVYRREVNADDVIDVLRKAVHPPETIDLTIPGLNFPKGGGLPNQVFKECNGALWGALMLDGALAHLSQAVHDRARKHLGFSINWGPVGPLKEDQISKGISRHYQKICS